MFFTIESVVRALREYAAGAPVSVDVKDSTGRVIGAVPLTIRATLRRVALTLERTSWNIRPRR